MAVAQKFILLKLALLFSSMLIDTCCSQEQQNGLGNECSVRQITHLEGRVHQLANRLDDALIQLNRLKKLSLTTVDMTLSPEHDTCSKNTEETGIQGGWSATIGGSKSCRFLGTANAPALSCEQLLAACQVPSGFYYVQGGQATFHRVFCDMDSFGGGWTRFGKGNMSSLWNYINEDEETTNLDIISESDILRIKSLNFVEFRILTDVELWLQADNSINPSLLSVNFLPSLSPGQMQIVGSADHTRLVFDDQGDHIKCFAGSSSRCGHGGTPAVGVLSQQLLIRSAFFGPQASGASAYQDNWSRNKYTWNGSYYYVLAK